MTLRVVVDPTHASIAAEWLLLNRCNFSVTYHPSGWPVYEVTELGSAVTAWLKGQTIEHYITEHE